MPFGVDPSIGKTTAVAVPGATNTAAPAPAAPVGAPISVPAPIGATGALAQNPAYLAFLRASGLQEQIALGDAARRRDQINQALGLSIEDLESGGEQARRGISNSQEDRGVFRSGQTLQRMSEQETDQARRRQAIELAGAGQLGDIEYGLVEQRAGLGARGAELGLSLSTDRDYDDGLTALKRRYS